MADATQVPARPEADQARPVASPVRPDVAAQPRPAGHAEPPLSGNSTEGGEGRLQDVLPGISEMAQKVGGYKHLAEIADTLDKMGK
jgi:hypothetical protein